jgi:hypothetical protein
MDSFNINKDGKTPGKPGDPMQTPADRARKGLFSRKEKAPKQVPAPIAPPAQAGIPQTPSSPAAKQPKQKKQAVGGAAAGGSNTSKIILLAILGVVILGAAGFFVFNNLINKPVEMPVANPNIRRPFPGPGNTAQRPGIPGNMNTAAQQAGNAAKQTGQPEMQGRPGRPSQATLPTEKELPVLPEKGKPAKRPVSAAPAAQPKHMNQAQVPPPVVTRKTEPVLKPVVAVVPVKPVVKVKQAPVQKVQPVQNTQVVSNKIGTRKPVAKVARVPVRRVAKPVVIAEPMEPVLAAAPKPKAKPAAVKYSATSRKRTEASIVSFRKVTPAATVQISSLPNGSRLGRQPSLKDVDNFYDWPGGKSAGHNKDIFDSQPSLLKQEHEKTMDEFSSSKKLYMVLVKEAGDVNELKDMGRKLPSISPPPEIKQTESHGRQVYWLTVGHYTTADKAYNKAQELKSLGVETTVVSEKIYY